MPATPRSRRPPPSRSSPARDAPALPDFPVGEPQLRAILDALPARIALYDRERRHRYVNQEYARFVGRVPEQVVGLTLEELIGRPVYGRMEPFYLELRPHSERALGGTPSRWEGWLPFNAEGRARYVNRTYVPHRDAAGEVIGYFVFTRDLTELKRSEALNAAITAAALDCIIVADEEGRIVEFNPAAERCFGHARAAVLNRPVGELIVSPALRVWLRATKPNGSRPAEQPLLGRRIEVAGRRADGTQFPAELAAAEVRLPDRRLVALYLHDLTAEHAATAEINRQRDALMQAEKLAALGSLLAGVAHELNNPLSIVLAGALMLEEELEEAGLADRAERAAKVRAAAERCARIVRSFLAMARQQAVRPRAVALAPVVEGVLELLAYGLRSAGVVVVREIPADLPPLLADPDHLHQVLANLVTNARQALEAAPGRRRIRIAARCVGDLVEVSVADSGPGVPVAVRRRVFDPFFTTKPAGAGTGIGLAVSRGLIEALGGTLDLADAGSGAGACFVLRLPRSVGAEVVAETVPAATPPAAA
ncbi:MAG: PAS domain S-box protein, partial [Acetobacteraceae bacterium]|nr:PAS domain S-box protein [Acetobacteraceae bacterium]